MSAKAWESDLCILETLQKLALSLAFWSSYIVFFYLLAGTQGTCMCPRTVKLLQVSFILRINPITLQQYLFLISVFPPSLCSYLMIEMSSFCMDQIWKQYLEGLIQSQDMMPGVLFLPLTFERWFKVDEILLQCQPICQQSWCLNPIPLLSFNGKASEAVLQCTLLYVSV